MLRISQGGKDSTTITITPTQGSEIREYLEKNIDCRFSTYCQQVGIGYTNILAMLGGRKTLSLKTLQRLFSRTEIEIECRVEFIIQKKSGNPANDACYPSLEEELFYEGMAEYPTEQLSGTVNSSTGGEKSKMETNQNTFLQEDPFEERRISQ